MQISKNWFQFVRHRKHLPCLKSLNEGCSSYQGWWGMGSVQYFKQQSWKEGGVNFTSIRRQQPYFLILGLGPTLSACSLFFSIDVILKSFSKCSPLWNVEAPPKEMSYLHKVLLVVPPVFLKPRKLWWTCPTCPSLAIHHLLSLPTGLLVVAWYGSQVLKVSPLESKFPSWPVVPMVWPARKGLPTKIEGRPLLNGGLV